MSDHADVQGTQRLPTTMNEAQLLVRPASAVVVFNTIEPIEKILISGTVFNASGDFLELLAWECDVQVGDEGFGRVGTYMPCGLDAGGETSFVLERPITGTEAIWLRSRFSNSAAITVTLKMHIAVRLPMALGLRDYYSEHPGCSLKMCIVG